MLIIFCIKIKELLMLHEEYDTKIYYEVLNYLKESFITLMDPTKYWIKYGPQSPLLKEIFDLLSLIAPSSASIERNFSNLGNIQQSRLRLSP